MMMKMTQMEAMIERRLELGCWAGTISEEKANEWSGPSE
jgi:hypothetical protein